MKLSAAEHLPVERIAEMNTVEEKIGEKRSIKTCRNSTLDDVLGKAREAGVSYGKYVAMMDGTPKIWQGEE